VAHAADFSKGHLSNLERGYVMLGDAGHPSRALPPPRAQEPSRSERGCETGRAGTCVRSGGRDAPSIGGAFWLGAGVGAPPTPRLTERQNDLSLPHAAESTRLETC
jgi:hypothetical protein